MPTGYTDPVRTGKVTTLSEYAAICARAFGAFIHQRDDSQDSVLRMPKKDDSYRRSWNNAVVELSRWDNKNEEQKYAEWSDYYRNTINHAVEARTNAAIEKARYEGMINLVNHTDVPESLAKMKEFMISQLESSVAFDCPDYLFNEPEILDYVTYCEQHRKRLLKNVEYYRVQKDAAERRYSEQVEFIKTMSDTFGFKVEPA